MFRDYVKKLRKDKESGGSSRQREAAYNELLRETKDIQPGIRWRDAKLILEKDTRYHAIESKRLREDLFRDYLEELEDSRGRWLIHLWNNGKNSLHKLHFHSPLYFIFAFFPLFTHLCTSCLNQRHFRFKLRSLSWWVLSSTLFIPTRQVDMIIHLCQQQPMLNYPIGNLFAWINLKRVWCFGQSAISIIDGSYGAWFAKGALYSPHTW